MVKMEMTALHKKNTLLFMFWILYQLTKAEGECFQTTVEITFALLACMIQSDGVAL